MPVCAACLAKVEPLKAEYCCVTCRAPFANAFPLDEHGQCGLCRSGLSGFDAAYSYGFYEGRLRELIQIFKYGKVSTLAGPLGEHLAAALPRDQQYDAIVPMPMHWWRQFSRGFNQAELLAADLGRRTGLPVVGLVRRKKATRPQAGLTGAKRRANVAAAFRIPHPSRAAGKRLLLIDDVLTTGATAGACARELKRAGAARVTVLTVARADRRVWTETGTSKAAFQIRPMESLGNGESRSIA